MPVIGLLSTHQGILMKIAASHRFDRSERSRLRRRPKCRERTFQLAIRREQPVDLTSASEPDLSLHGYLLRSSTSERDPTQKSFLRCKIRDTGRNVAIS